jgi:hypothetical protein
VWLSLSSAPLAERDLDLDLERFDCASFSFSLLSARDNSASKPMGVVSRGKEWSLGELLMLWLPVASGAAKRPLLRPPSEVPDLVGLIASRPPRPFPNSDESSEESSSSRRPSFLKPGVFLMLS